MSDELDEEERALLEKHRAAKREAEANDERRTHRVQIGRGDSWAEFPALSDIGKKVGKFFKNELGIDLDEEPVQDPEPKAPKPKEGEGAEVKRFVAGRRVS